MVLQPSKAWHTCLCKNAVLVLYTFIMQRQLRLVSAVDGRYNKGCKDNMGLSFSSSALDGR